MRELRAVGVRAFGLRPSFSGAAVGSAVAFAAVLTAAFAAVSSVASPADAQERVTPAKAKGGFKYGAPLAEVPESFRDLKIPEWPTPTDLKRWQEVDRAAVRKILFDCLGEMPARPDPRGVKTISRTDHGDYVLERFEFSNGVDMVVPGILAIPNRRRGPLPAIVAMHGHSGSKEMYVPDLTSESSLGGALVKQGFVVAAIDGYFNGERVFQGPRGKQERDAYGQEMSLFKLHLWQGRTLWGMMLREEQCLIDYLQTRAEVDPRRIGATGMSMGCTRAWWLSAIDDRVQSIVGVACFTRFRELMAHAKTHGIYYYVPGLLKHFDAEAIYAVTAPRPMLMLSGDQDHNAPPDGVEVLEQKVSAVYRLYGRPENFRSVLYKNTGHEYLPEMRQEMVAWFVKTLAAP